MLLLFSSFIAVRSVTWPGSLENELSAVWRLIAKLSELARINSLTSVCWWLELKLCLMKIFAGKNYLEEINHVPHLYSSVFASKITICSALIFGWKSRGFYRIQLIVGGPIATLEKLVPAHRARRPPSPDLDSWRVGRAPPWWVEVLPILGGGDGILLAQWALQYPQDHNGDKLMTKRCPF